MKVNHSFGLCLYSNYLSKNVTFFLFSVYHVDSNLISQLLFMLSLIAMLLVLVLHELDLLLAQILVVLHHLLLLLLIVLHLLLLHYQWFDFLLVIHEIPQLVLVLFSIIISIIVIIIFIFRIIFFFIFIIVHSCNPITVKINLSLSVSKLQSSHPIFSTALITISVTGMSVTFAQLIMRPDVRSISSLLPCIIWAGLK